MLREHVPCFFTTTGGISTAICRESSKPAKLVPKWESSQEDVRCRKNAWCVTSEEENGYLKITEFRGKLVADTGREIQKITYIKSTRISSIQLVANESGKRAIIITTEELIPVKGSGANADKTYTIKTGSLKPKYLEREIDAVLSEIKSHVTRMKFKE